jgi:hypothetical protein|tara:strand:- start:301 stop:630 length:330 start_codon:yes stop_codon:yes gene_type:complete
MELGARELLTIATVLGGLFATWGVVKTKLGQCLQEISELKAELQHAIHRADKEASSQSVIEQRVKVLTDILSPSNQAIQNRQMATVVATVDALKDEIKTLRSMHNGKHP